MLPPFYGLKRMQNLFALSLSCDILTAKPGILTITIINAKKHVGKRREQEKNTNRWID